MGSIVKGVLANKVWQPLLQTVRYRKVNVQRPRAPHYDRARFEALAKPIFAKPVELLLPLSAKCKKTEEQKIINYRIDNPYEKLLAQDCLRLFNDSALVAICQINPIKAEPKFNMYIRFKKDNMVIKEYGRHVMELAVKGTKFEPILDLYTVRQLTIFCPELKVKELLKIVKKTPELILLAGIVDGYYANVNQIQEFANLNGDIALARAQLVSTLNSAAQSVVTNLNQHQTLFTCSLDQYVNINQTEPVAKDSSDKETSVDDQVTETPPS